MRYQEWIEREADWNGWAQRRDRNEEMNYGIEPDDLPDSEEKDDERTV